VKGKIAPPEDNLGLGHVSDPPKDCLFHFSPLATEAA